MQDDTETISWMLRHELVDLAATNDLGNTAAHLAVFHDSPRYGELYTTYRFPLFTARGTALVMWCVAQVVPKLLDRFAPSNGVYTRVGRVLKRSNQHQTPNSRLPIDQNMACTPSGFPPLRRIDLDSQVAVCSIYMTARISFARTVPGPITV